MYVFIPQWTGLNQEKTDEIIGQIKSFMEIDLDAKIIIPDYLPNLRYFLHRQGILEFNYVNIFDVLQGRIDQKQKALDLEDLGFSKNCSYIYTPFHILVYEQDRIIAQISHGEGAHLSSISRYDQFEQLASIDIYDDRGFLSSQKKFSSGKQVSHVFLDKQGEWIFYEKTDSKIVQVNKENSKGLKKIIYPDIASLKGELIQSELSSFTDGLHVILSISDESSKYDFRLLKNQKLALSFFGERFNLSQDLDLSQLTKKADYILVDTDKKKKVLEKFHSSISKITPYDTRFMLSISQELKEEVILCDIRHLPEHIALQTISLIMEYLLNSIQSDKSDRVFQIYLRIEGDDFENIIDKVFREKYPDQKDNIEDFIINPGMIENTIDQEVYSRDKDITDKRMNKVKESFKISRIDSEEDFFKLINRTRLIIDMSEEPDIFTQIASISAGIPQINRISTEYCQDGKNGIILSKMEDLPQAIKYYLESLKNWSNARVDAVQKIKQYSGKSLKDQLIKILSKGDDVET